MTEQHIVSYIDYHRFTLMTSEAVTVARRDDPASFTTFCFDDDVWDLLNILRPHERNYDSRIVFFNVVPWLRGDAKRYVAHIWIRAEWEANRFQQLMVSIRDLGRYFPYFTGAPIDLRSNHSREFSRRYVRNNYGAGTFQKTRRALNGFISFVRRLHPEVKENDFKVTFPKEKTFSDQHRPLELSQSARIGTEVLAKIIDGCTTDTAEYFKALEDYIDPIERRREYDARWKRRRYSKEKQGLPLLLGHVPRLKELLGRAIKAQAVILAVCVGRRPAAICNTRFDVKTEEINWANETGRREQGVLVRFREFKIRNVNEDVFCPGVFGEMALKAISTAKELTIELRRHNPQWGDYLFLVPGKARKSAMVISLKQIREYINGFGAKGREFGGLRQRYRIPSGRIKTHSFRHTRATNMWLGGLQVHEVAYDLGHASAEMTVRHYIVGAEESRRRLQFLIDHGALSGILEDFVGGREMVRARLGRHHVEIMEKQGRIITPTRYGYCCLPSASGPCTRAAPCYSGPSAEGCDHHVLSPDAIPALLEDRELLEANVLVHSSDPELRAWVENHRNQLAVVGRKLKLAELLHQKTVGCEGVCDCRQNSKDKKEVPRA
jgi:hypothetical protein